MFDHVVTRFPEWKALYDAILPLIDGGQSAFSYEELDELAGMDTRSGRGRNQFYRFRKQLLKDRQLWLENVPKSGYVIISAGDHPNAAYRRVGMARRKISMAKAINSNLQIEKLTPEQRIFQAATAAVLNELSKSFHAAGHRFKIASQTLNKLPVDLPKLIDSISGDPPKKN